MLPSARNEDMIPGCIFEKFPQGRRVAFRSVGKKGMTVFAASGEQDRRVPGPCGGHLSPADGVIGLTVRNRLGSFAHLCTVGLN